jgi:hypothetical protein
MCVLFVCTDENMVCAHCDCCEAMHACACLCMNKAHGHSDCCEAVHAFVGLFVCSCAQGAC